jgi:hypothetical protein
VHGYIALIREKYQTLRPFMDERLRRLWAATEAHALGHGGITAVSRATGLSRTTITRGLHEPQEIAAPPRGRIRRAGGGRKALREQDGTLLHDLESLVDPLWERLLDPRNLIVIRSVAQ